MWTVLQLRCPDEWQCVMFHSYGSCIVTYIGSSAAIPEESKTEQSDDQLTDKNTLAFAYPANYLHAHSSLSISRVYIGMLTMLSETFGDCWTAIFTGWILFLTSNQQHKMPMQWKQNCLNPLNFNKINSMLTLPLFAHVKVIWVCKRSFSIFLLYRHIFRPHRTSA